MRDHTKVAGNKVESPRPRLFRDPQRSTLAKQEAEAIAAPWHDAKNANATTEFMASPPVSAVSEEPFAVRPFSIRNQATAAPSAVGSNRPASSLLNVPVLSPTSQASVSGQAPIANSFHIALSRETPDIQREDEDEEQPTPSVTTNTSATTGDPSANAEDQEQHPIPPVVEELLQGKFLAQRAGSAPITTPGSNDIEHRIQASKGSGSQLPKETLSFMQPRFGANFRDVRVHTDSESVQMNRQLGAQAFAHGSDIYFGQGKFNPSSDSGKWLLAHELTHVVQQTGGVQTKLTIGAPDDAYEREADSVANRVMRMSASSRTAPAQRYPEHAYPTAYLDFLQTKPLDVGESEPVQGVSLRLQTKCAECEEEEMGIQTRLDASSFSPLVTHYAPTSVQRGFFTGRCIAEHWNLAAAITSLVAAASASIALILAPDPTTVSKWVAVGAVAGVISGIAWTVNGIIALRDCLNSDPNANAREIESLNRRLQQLEQAQQRIQQMQGGGQAQDGGQAPDAQVPAHVP